MRKVDFDKSRGYQIGTGRKVRIDMNGQFVQTVERNRIVVEVLPGSTIVVSDAGPPSPGVTARGPARPAVEEITFEAFGAETTVDLERSQGGTTGDISYDHITGEISMINGAEVAYIRHPGGLFHQPFDLNAIPTELDCQGRTDWTRQLSANDLMSTTIACVKTAEADLGYIVIWPHTKKPPATLEFYSLVWVR